MSLGPVSFAGRSIGFSGNPYIIAEIGVNHEGSMDRAKALIRKAKQGGAQGAKFQTYKAHMLAIKDSPAYWDRNKEATSTQLELFSKYDGFEPEDYRELAQYCEKLGIDFLSTPFDLEAVEFLSELVPFFKIASADITNLPLLQAIAATGIPVALSTGASNLEEISSALEILSLGGTPETALLHCVLSYPTSDEDAHLRFIRGLQKTFPHLIIGYSDHTASELRALPLLIAHLHGALILEKHFTDDKNQPGNDHYHAMDSTDLKWLTSVLAETARLLGDEEHRAVLPVEASSRLEARRSLVAIHKLYPGDVVSPDSLIAKRPGGGISPMQINAVVGKKVVQEILEDTQVRWEDLK